MASGSRKIFEYVRGKCPFGTSAVFEELSEIQLSKNGKREDRIEKKRGFCHLQYNVLRELSPGVKFGSTYQLILHFSVL